jgi:hypothetical protein
MVFLAGMVAQSKFSSRSVRNYHGHRDFHAAVDLMGYFFESPVLDRNLEFLAARMQVLFDQDPYAWKSVKAVAKALMEEKQLSGAQLTEVIKTKTGRGGCRSAWGAGARSVEGIFGRRPDV